MKDSRAFNQKIKSSRVTPTNLHFKEGSAGAEDLASVSGEDQAVVEKLQQQQLSSEDNASSTSTDTRMKEGTGQLKP